jgi:hypothetical protein
VCRKVSGLWRIYFVMLTTLAASRPGLKLIMKDGNVVPA